jgi:hypothetical protein
MRADSTFFGRINEEEWFAAAKYDGWGVTGLFGDKGITFFNPDGKPITKQSRISPEIWEAAGKISLPADTFVRFELIGPRGHFSPHLRVLDVLAWHGVWLGKTEFEQRWKLAQKIGEQLKTPLIQLADLRTSNLEAFYTHLKEDWVKQGGGMHLWEGVVLYKRSGLLDLSFYKNSKTSSLIKIKYREVKEPLF